MYKKLVLIVFLINVFALNMGAYAQGPGDEHDPIQHEDSSATYNNVKNIDFTEEIGDKLKLFDNYYNIGIDHSTMYFQIRKENHKFEFRGLSDNDPQLKIETNGNVGIGTNNPSQKLDVNGTVKANRFEGDGTALKGTVLRTPENPKDTNNGTWPMYVASFFCKDNNGLCDGKKNGVAENQRIAYFEAVNNQKTIHFDSSHIHANNLGLSGVLMLQNILPKINGTNFDPLVFGGNWNLEPTMEIDFKYEEGFTKDETSRGKRKVKIWDILEVVGNVSANSLEVAGTVKANTFEDTNGNKIGTGKWVDGTDSGKIYYTDGYVGIGRNNPEALLHVQGSVIFAKQATSQNGAYDNVPYLDFVDAGTEEVVGSIISQEKKFPSGAVKGVKLESAGADYAEYLLKVSAKEKIGPGSVVGVFNGKVSLKTKGADRVMVVSTMPLVVGNKRSEMTAGSSVAVAFVGQVPVRVVGAVRSGDYVIASGKHNGTAVAVTPENLKISDVKYLIGRAWETQRSTREKVVTVGISPFDFPATLLEQLEERTNKRLEFIEGRLERLEG